MQVRHFLFTFERAGEGLGRNSYLNFLTDTFASPCTPHTSTHTHTHTHTHLALTILVVSSIVAASKLSGKVAGTV